jgi:DNA-binding transcriptional LysR family regulator
MVTLAQLRTFRIVARLNSFSRAAEELHITQPAVSAQIVALEDVLQVKLFDRVGKKFKLSAAGDVVLQAADEVLERLSGMHIELQDLQQLRSGDLTIGASQVAGVYLLPELLAEFQEHHPGIQISVRIELARRVLDMLLEGDIDCALVGEGAAVSDSRIAIKPVALDELVLIVPCNHIFAELRKVSATSLSQMTLLLPRRDSASSECTLERLAAVGIQPKSVMELGNVGAVKRAVEAGLGISIVSRIAVSHELADGRLKSVALGDLDMVRQISLCWLHDRRFSKATEAFVAYVHRWRESGQEGNRPDTLTELSTHAT